MKSVDTSDCLAHVLVCVNDRPDSSLPCCADGRASRVADNFRQWLEQRGLTTRIWLTRTDCLGWCHRDGTTVVFYPEGSWYRAVDPKDCSKLIERHLAPLVPKHVNGSSL